VKGVRKFRRTWRIAGVALLAAACAGGGPLPREGGAPLAPCPRSPNCVSSLASDDAHRVAPLVLRAPADRAWAEVRRAVEALPRTRIVDERPGTLRAECTSRWLRFVDDLELALAADGARIDVRSASRVGHSDLGVNRARVESLRASLRAAGVVD
jgi:uncharacterized protein (DUF1499 family)